MTPDNTGVTIDDLAGWGAPEARLDVAGLERQPARSTARRLLADLHREAWADLEDLDGDGQPEVVLTAGDLSAVLDPTTGGRVVGFGWGRPGLPSAHDGAPVLSLRGAERDCWQVVGLESTGEWAEAELVDAQVGSAHEGARVRYTLRVGAATLAARFRLPVGGGAVDALLAPGATLTSPDQEVDIDLTEAGAGATATAHLDGRDACLVLTLHLDLS